MKTSSLDGPRHCAQCGTVLSDYALEGVCGNCLLKPGLEPLLKPLDEPANETSFPALGAGSNRSSNAEMLGRFGDYELLEEIARGGMGVVYRARQVSLDRVVAVKMLLAGPLATKDFVQRFRTESAAAASLQHPNIVAIHEVGFAQGQHFFAMDFVEGLTLAQLVAKGPLPARQAATYLKSIAEAIHFAHERNVLHRDLKPSNVLIDSATDQPRVTDFGLAKRLEAETELTLSGQLLGSPNYMSPEQATAKRGTVGKRSDVYSLGAILYHLLTGRPPFQGETLTDLLNQLADDDPLAPHLLTPRIPHDLETICLKCLEKEPAKRYQTAEELADELDRFLRDEPIHAHPITRAERAWRWCRRKPVLAGLIVALNLVLALGLTGILWEWRRASFNARAEKEQRERAEAALTRLEIQRVQDFLESDNSSAALAYLARVLRKNPMDDVAAERLMSALTHLQFVLPACPLLPSEMSLTCAQFDSRGERVVTASEDHTARIWDARTGRQLTSPLQHEDGVMFADFSPDGRQVVTASMDRTARVWDAQTGLPLTPPLRHDGVVWSAQFSPDGEHVATASHDGTARIWDARTGQPVGQPLVHKNRVWYARFSPDGRQIVTASEDGTAVIWHAKTCQSNAVLKHSAPVRTVRFSLDGKFVVTGSADDTAQVWDAHSGLAIGNRLNQHGEVKSGCISPDGRCVVTSGGDGTARIWDARTGQPLTPPLKHNANVWFAQFSPDGRWILTGSGDGTARIWDAHNGLPASEPVHHDDQVAFGQFSLDGRRIVTIGGKAARVWQFSPDQPFSLQLQHNDRVTSGKFSPDGQRVLTGSADGTARIWDARTGQPLISPLKHGRGVNTATFSPDGQRIATASADGTARVWDARSGEPLTQPLKHEAEVNAAVFDPAGQRIVTCSDDNTARVWDAHTGQPLTPPLRHQREVKRSEFSPDGRWVVTGSYDNTARIWDAATGQPLSEPLKHKQGVVWATKFSSDGRHLLTASMDNSACLWDVRTGQALLEFKHMAIVNRAHFSPDGLWVATASFDGTARVWDARTGQPTSPPLKHGGRVEMVEFSADSRRLATASRDGAARIWDVPSGQLLAGPFKHDGWVFSASFSPDGQRVLTTSRDESARIWELPLAPVPVPAWLPELAEALAAQRFNAKGFSESVRSDELWHLKQRLSDSADSDPYTLWAKRFFAGHTSRVSPSASPDTASQTTQR